MKKEILVHFINTKGVIVFKRIVTNPPNVGDEVRRGGPGNERFYSIWRRVWAYDEPDCPFERLNVEVKEIEEVEDK